MARRHKKGLSARQVRQWTAVATSTYASCVERGGTASTCEARAIRAANSVTGTPELDTNAMLQTITVHVSGAQVRREQLDGREYLVAPVVPIVAGVLNHYLVPAEEIAAFVDAWNGLTLPVYHPTNEYGDYISANSPALLEQSVGRFFNATMDGNKLVGELWIDVEKCQRLGGEALDCLERLESGQSLEVSTAFYPETSQEQGIFNGVRYIGVHRHLRPDHLALLPTGIGACSWADGCGAPRTHQQCTCADACPCQGAHAMTHAHATTHRPTGETSPDETGQHGLIRHAINTIKALVTGSPGVDLDHALATHLTHDDLRMALSTALAKQQEEMVEHMGLSYGPGYYGGCYLTDIENETVIFSMGSHSYRLGFTVAADGAVALTGEPEEVQRNTTYIPVVMTATQPPGEPSSQASQPGGAMKPKADLIQSLIAHAHTGWTDDDTPILESFSDEQLTRLVVEAEARTPAPAHQGAAQGSVTDTASQSLTIQTQAAPALVTLEAIQGLLTTELDKRDRALKADLVALTQQATEQSERQQLGTVLQEHYTTEQLATMSLDVLRKTVQLVSPVSYAGMGLPHFPGQPSTDADLPSDDVNWDSSFSLHETVGTRRA